ncbi:hypothetical protein GC207_04070 [bacterium]|nr:hypothetical protein [bacterium]
MTKKRFLAVVVPVLLLVFALFVVSNGPRVVERGVAAPGSSVTMDRLQIKGSSGFRALGRGIRTKSKVTLFRLPMTNVFWRAINEHTLKQAREDVAKFGEMANWRNVWFAVRVPSVFRDEKDYELWLDAKIDAELVTPQLVSTIADRWKNAGGIRPLRYLDAINAVPEGNSFREVQLGEFFRTGTNWLELLAVRMTELMNQEKRRIYGTNMSERELVTVKPDEVPKIVFTVNSVGFKFWTAPFRKFEAENYFEPEIPYSDVVTILNTNGPARSLPCFLNKR